MPDFFDGLVAHKLIVPTKAAGAFGRGPVFEDVLGRFDRMVLASARDEDVEALTFPPVMDRGIIERTGYMESFANLAGTVHAFSGTEREARVITQRIANGERWDDLLGMTDVALAPAACYPVYPLCSGVLPPNGRHITLRSWVYRQEPSNDPTRLRAFRVREFIRLGAPDVVLEWRDMWKERGLALLAALDLPVTLDVAADPFFGRAGKMLAAGQLEQKLKFEVLVPIIDGQEPTACCSFNYHQDKFGSTFDIRLPDGSIAHSACLGFGMERVVLALFRIHGFDPDAWPADVRAKLGS